MTFSDATYRTLRNVTITLRDGTPEDIVFSGTLEGEPSTTAQWDERMATRSRGSLDGYILGEEQEGTMSFAMKLNEVIGTATPSSFNDLNPLQFLFDPENSNVTSTGTGGEPNQFTIEVKIDRPGTDGYETYTMSKCVFDAPALTMGFPCVVQVSIRYRGDYAWAFSAAS